MDDKYIRIRKDILCKIIISIVIIILAGLLVFQIHNRIEEKKANEYTPVEYVDITYEDLKSKVTDKEDCFICGSPEMSLMPYYRKFDTLGIISLNDCYVIDLGLKAYDGVGKEMSDEGSTSIRSTSLDNVKYTVHSTASRGMADIEITVTEDVRLDTKNLEKNLCSDCLPKVAEVLEHSYKKGDEKKETIPLCLIDFETLEVYSMQDFYRGYFVRDYWVQLDFIDDKIELEAFYLPVRE